MGEEIEVYEAPAVDAALSVRPEVGAADLVARLAVIQDAMRQAMTSDVDYGVIPGTGSKPTLLKPGAEKLAALFQLDVQLENEKTWHEDGHLTVVSRALVFHQPTGHRLGSGEGICSTRESKYAYRNADRVCPSCGAAAIIKGKAEYGGGWVCFKKKGGCGAKYADDDGAIVGQASGKVPNEALADAYNTVDKMASKRARIDAVLAVTGASALFTQDVEEFAPAEDAARSDSKAAGAPPVRQEYDQEPAKSARSYGEWVARMTALEVPRAEEWAQSAINESGVGKSGMMARLNRVMLWFSDREPASSVGFWSREEIAEGFGVGFDGVLVPPPADPLPSSEEDPSIPFGESDA